MAATAPPCRLTVRLSATLAAQLHDFCAQHGFTAAHLVRQGLQLVLAQDPQTLRPPPPPTPARQPRPPSLRAQIVQIVAAAVGPIAVKEICAQLPDTRTPSGRLSSNPYLRRYSPWYIQEVCRQLKYLGRLERVAPATYTVPGRGTHTLPSQSRSVEA